MKHPSHHRSFLLPALICLCLVRYASGQDIDSKSARIYIDNLPDTEPPVVRIMSPEIHENIMYSTDIENIDLIGEAKDKSGIKFISVNSDLKMVNQAGIFSSRLLLSPGINRVRIVAADINDNLVEKNINIEYVPPVITLADRIREGSKYYALIIGIDTYADPDLPDLENPTTDAEKLYNTLTSLYTFTGGNMMLLRDAKRNDIIHALDYLSNKVTPEDNVLIFYAGHGYWDEKANVGFWLPADAYLNTTANWFRNSTLVDYLRTIDSKHTLLITDACFGGSIFQTRSAFPKQEKAYEVLYESPSRKAMTSGTLTEVPDRSEFTRYLLQKLSNNRDTYLSSEELFSSFRIAVINNTDALPQYGEIKNVGDAGGDFIFLRRR